MFGFEASCPMIDERSKPISYIHEIRESKGKTLWRNIVQHCVVEHVGFI